MFPSNLHKNIAQLDKQISLLENECKNIETDNKIKVFKSQQPLNKCSKASKISPGRVPNKKSNTCDNLRCTKKVIPPFSARVKSASSLHSTYSKPWSELTEPVVGRVNKKGVNKNSDVRAENETTQNYSKKSTKCTRCSEGPSPDILKCENNVFINPVCNKKEEILHKEILLSRSGERIEVTLTQKPNIDDIKENVPLQVERRTCHTPEQDYNCLCNSKKQKWSDILSLDSEKKKAVHKNFGSQTNSDETHFNHQYFVPNGFKTTPQDLNNSQAANSRSSLDKIYEVPVKLITNAPNVQKKDFCEKNNLKKNSTSLKKNELLQLFELLIEELEHKSDNERKKILSKMESQLNKLTENKPVKSFKKSENEEEKVKLFQPVSTKIETQDAVKQPCSTVNQEVEVLSQEILEKNKTIGVLQKREEEYLALITQLRKNLEKVKGKTHQNAETLKELDAIKQKFLEHTKISEALKKSHSKMQQILERYVLENDKLKTQIQIYKLETQKHDVLLAGKEAEIKRYKEEIQNFQRQISDHLSVIKSNAQANDIEKMLEAFMHHSQFFISKDDVEKELKQSSSSKQQNGLLHSSPTSTKTSLVNSSWKQISSIREQNQNDIDNAIQVNADDEKEYFQIFGDDSVSNSQSKITLTGKKDKIKFTKCLSLQDEDNNYDDEDDDCGYSSTSRNEFLLKKESESLTSKKVQSNIDELLQQMKLKWSKEICKPSESGTIEDFFNSSQISSISMVSGNSMSEKSSKEKQ